MNERFQNALRRTPQAVPPIWMMRQAGRYHSHYQALRAKHTFEQLCKQPELACEVALGPVQDFDFDAAILFNDILFPLEAVGFGLQYTDKGPQLSHKLRDEKDLDAFKPAAEAGAFLKFQGEGVRLTRQALPADKSLIGFVGGLWTLFAYACDGSHVGSLPETKKRMALFPRFLKTFVPVLSQTIRNQLDAGAEIVMIFDTAAGELDPLSYQKYVAPSLIELAKEFPNRLGYFAKASNEFYFSPEFRQAPWLGQGFDYRYSLPSILKSTKKGFVQGNFDPVLLQQSEGDFAKTLNEYLQPFKSLTPDERAGWVCGLGHGVLPATPEANVRTFVRTVREVFGE